VEAGAKGASHTGRELDNGDQSCEVNDGPDSYIRSFCDFLSSRGQSWKNRSSTGD
jgi:hypothetical protein